MNEVEERTIKYIGKNKTSIPGVPMRDLTLAEYENHRELIEACPVKLYKVPKADKKKPAPKKDAGKEKPS